MLSLNIFIEMLEIILGYTNSRYCISKLVILNQKIVYFIHQNCLIFMSNFNCNLGEGVFGRSRVPLWGRSAVREFRVLSLHFAGEDWFRPREVDEAEEKRRTSDGQSDKHYYVIWRSADGTGAREPPEVAYMY